MRRFFWILLGALLLLAVSACDLKYDYYKVKVTISGETTEYVTCQGVMHEDGGRYLRLLGDTTVHCSHSRTTIHLPQDAIVTSTPLYPDDRI